MSAPQSTADSAYMLTPGTLVGRYRLLSLVASGGMAQIWAAKPESGGFSRTVALKVIRPEHAADDEYKRMLIDEAAAAAAVHHPNVCEVFELGQEGDIVFIAMEWVPGDSVAGLIRQGEQYVPFTFALAARIIADACAGLHAAHNAVGADGKPMNIIHRDISPQNILLSSQGHVKVSDFGIAKARDQLHSKTRTGEIKGKFAYIAPEQILGQPVDLRADLYAMGCVLYVATLGMRPFGRGNHSVMAKIVQGDFKRPLEVMPSYPPALDAIVTKALARVPAERFQTAEEMRLSLEDWLAKSGKIVTHTDISRAVTERLSPQAREQIQSLRSANKFTPRSIAARVDDESGSDRWDLPTAVSGLIQVPTDLGQREPPAQASRNDRMNQPQISARPVVSSKPGAAGPEVLACERTAVSLDVTAPPTPRVDERDLRPTAPAPAPAPAPARFATAVRAGAEPTPPAPAPVSPPIHVEYSPPRAAPPPRATERVLWVCLVLALMAIAYLAGRQ